jgi:flavin-dependent dehydrogenase
MSRDELPEDRALPLELARRRWDTVIVGAGPAGSIAARQLAIQGKAVLVVDRAYFPRAKVCGGCLNATAVELLKQIGLGDILPRLRARSIRGITLAASGRIVPLELQHGGVSVSREAFDLALLDEAKASGAHCLQGANARLSAEASEFRTVELTVGWQRIEVETKVVIAADGLRGSLLRREPRFRRLSVRRPRIGVGAILADPPDRLETGRIYMAVGAGGYVGMVRLEDGQLDVAAALDVGASGDKTLSHQSAGPAQAARRIVVEAGLYWPEPLSRLKWHGTAQLSRRLAHVADHRIFAIGDAAAYVEPFTGEGIAWAMSSACAAAPLVIQAIDGGCTAAAIEWDKLHRRLFGRRMLTCRAVSGLLRSKLFRHTAGFTLLRLPNLSAPLVQYFSAPAA